MSKAKRKVQAVKSADNTQTDPAANEKADTENTQPKRDTQSRKYILTLNDPIKKGWTHDKIKTALGSMKSIVYYCICDEMGTQTERFHTHVFLAASSPIRFSTIKNNFPEANIQPSRGSSQQNRDYLRKEGKYAETDKAKTSIPDSFEEWGKLPDDNMSGKNQLMKDLYSMVQDGLTDHDIISQNPDYIPYLDKIKQVRLTVLQEKYKTVWRDIDVTYVYGKTGLGKTRGIMEGHGYANVFRVTDYTHPFDTYESQDVLLLEEFSSSIRIQDLLNFLDGYPLKLPARYSDRQACYTKVYLASNIPLDRQYPNVQREEPKVWDALCRRIKTVREYTEPNVYTDYTTTDYLRRFHPISKDESTPFDKSNRKGA